MALVMANPAVMEGTLGHAGGCWRLGAWKLGPLSAGPRPPPPPPGLAMVVSCWKFAMVTTATAPCLAADSSGVRSSVQFSPRGLGAAAPNPLGENCTDYL